MVLAANKLAADLAATDEQTEAPRLPSAPAALTSQQQETAQYVADMILELRNMAKAARLYTITVPLEYAYYEAFSVANRVAVPVAEIERLRTLSQVTKEIETGSPAVLGD
jgi:hypothetical protein